MQSKSELRRQILTQRDALTPQEIRRRSKLASSLLLPLPEFTRARTILFFITFGSEITTIPLVEQALSQSKKVAAPRVDRSLRVLQPCQITNVEADLAPGYYGIREPQTHCPVLDLEEIDLVLVPAAVWAEDGYRIGYGGGFYDRFLATIPNTIWIGLGFELQVVMRVPHNPHDLPVDILVTDERVRRFERRRVED